MKKISLLFVLVLASVCTTGCSLSDFIKIEDTNQSQDDSSQTNDHGSGDNSGGGSDNGDNSGGSSNGGDDSGGGTLPGDGVIQNGYYKGIDTRKRGDDLLNELRSLNSVKHTGTVTYKQMGTSASTTKYIYTDYDPDTVKYDSNNQPYGDTIVSFYSGNKMTSFNKEHVWPQAHGGNAIEDDIHMPRPTIPAENGSRGCSFYIEGMKSKKNEGWDPAMEDFGDETYRGDSARIIFYCMVATKNLTLTDDSSHSSKSGNKEMGLVSDMLSWNLRYPVLDREQRRNSGAEYLQGNRNPFIDHPEFACKIWGTFNEKTKQICGGKY